MSEKTEIIEAMARLERAVIDAQSAANSHMAALGAGLKGFGLRLSQLEGRVTLLEAAGITLTSLPGTPGERIQRAAAELRAALDEVTRKEGEAK